MGVIQIAAGESEISCVQQGEGIAGRWEETGSGAACGGQGKGGIAGGEEGNESAGVEEVGTSAEQQQE